MTTLLKTIACAFLLLGILVAAKVLLEHHLAPSTSGIQAELREKNLDVLFVGSSHTRQGYDAELLEKLTGKRVFVLGYDGLDPVSMLPLMQALLADPANRPKQIVLEANCATLSRAPEIEEPRLFFDAPPSMKLALARAYLRTHHGTDAYLDMWTLAANRGSDTILAYPFVYKAIDSLSYHGSYVHKNLSAVNPALFPSLRIPLAGNVPNPEELTALGKVISFVETNHVGLMLAEPPLPASVESEPGMASLRQQLAAFANAGSVPYAQGADGFPIDQPSLFHDSEHLSTAGRELYTARFAQALQAKPQP